MPSEGDDEDAELDDEAGDVQAGPWPHAPVLADEVLAALGPAIAGEAPWLLDGTLGAGGHSERLLAAFPTARLLGLDRDPDALALARARLAPFGERARLVHSTYADAAAAAREAGAGPFAAILIDIGVSSMQLDRAERGFSFSRGGPLDMRMDPTGDGPTAADLVADLGEGELADVIYQHGEEVKSRRIARAIVEARARAPILTTERLAEVVRGALGGGGRGRIDPATRTFQALRIAVNDELGQLERGLPALFDLLAPGGRLAVIAFHSLEDRPAKRFVKARKTDGSGRPLTKKPVVAGDEERARNPRARSARLRVVERLGPAAPNESWRRRRR
jgi:16S rRNA (cytosine1402-N4)-methyltransferase